MKSILLITSCVLSATGAFAQQPLGKTVSIRVHNQPVDTVLQQISRQGRVNFSYIGAPFRKDSLVTLNVSHKSIKQVLDLLFNAGIQYVESGDNIILRRAEGFRERNYIISGYVRDRENGQAVSNASIYERATLLSTFTDGSGYFHLRLKDRGRQPSVQLTVSKELYMDTALYVMPGFDREISLTIAPAKPVLLKEFTVSDQVDKTWIGKRLLSEGLRRQTQNISKFFASKPFQSSIVPSVGSHGKMAGQVVNKVSLNLVGGYSAGLDGAEVAGGFNINKRDVQYVQAAGIFNIVGGSMTGGQAAGGVNHVMKSVNGSQAAGVMNIANDTVTGAQVAGLLNRALGDMTGMQAAGLINRSGRKMRGAQFAGLINTAADSMQGIQAAGLLNYVDGPASGLQAAGLMNYVDGPAGGLQAAGLMNYVDGPAGGIQAAGLGNFNHGGQTGAAIAGVFNHTGKSFNGLQLAGVANNAGDSLHGAQIAALANHSKGTVRGLQLGLLFNYARHLKGMQIGAINIADTSSGYGIGLVNIVRRGGYYKLSVAANEFMPVQLSFKSGLRKFYTMLAGGYDPGEKRHALGLGIGHVFDINRRFSVTAEVLQQNIFSSSWKSLGQVYRFQPFAHFQPAKWFSVHAGPAVSYSEKFKDPKLSAGKGAWLGWQVGISLF
ncbi:STN and carboxypeptidase regulatory-like domain-containing protein [Chitinophaga cymbidii]|uniref:STN and carboxypeptidase regulatory-like domain-containing protein n=1 Tax=Chitinophaga cymbidii TaxID=1096750 RepID=UPI0011BD4C44|nr:STN and carboxypeptidase regulatory-like domain-containing protein [Chitinophaga cymbidii]